MGKIYLMEVKTLVVVEAEDKIHAHELTNTRMMRDVISDMPEDSLSVDLIREIKTTAELRQYGWDGMCIPYGDTDGNTRLNQILPETLES